MSTELHAPKSDVEVPLHNDGISGGPPRFFAFVQLPTGTVVVGSCTRGMSRSTDRGLTWEPVEGLTNVSINAFAVAPDSALLAATSGGLARSVDDGRTWTFLHRDPSYATLPEGNDGRPTGLVTYRLLRLADGRTLAATDGHGVWVTGEGRWKPLGLDRSIVYSLAVTGSGTLLAGTRGAHVWRSTDGGNTWTEAAQGLTDSYVHCLHVRPDGAILAGTGTGLARSDDDGRTWTPYARPLEGNRIFSVTSLDDGRLLAGSYAHVWLGLDEDWSLVDPGLTPDEAWAVHFVDADRVLAGTKAGIMESSDRGRSWRPTGEPTVTFGFTTTDDGSTFAAGDVAVLRAPDWSPYAVPDRRTYSLLEVSPGTLLIGTLSDGLWRHHDGIVEPVVDGPPHRQVFDLHRTRTGAVIACTGTIIDGIKTGGIFRSEDLGASWTLVWEGENVYGAVSVSDGTIYAAARRCLVLESTDDARTWSACPPAVDHDAKTYSLGVDRRDRLYLGSGSQLLRSADRAQTWHPLDEGLDGLSIYALHEGPDGGLVAATSAGLFFSVTDGDSWDSGHVER